LGVTHACVQSKEIRYFFDEIPQNISIRPEWPGFPFPMAEEKHRDVVQKSSRGKFHAIA
jgi:hypothetical protein